MKIKKITIGGLGFLVFLSILSHEAFAVTLPITNTAKIVNHKTPAENLTVPHANIEFSFGDTVIHYWNVNNPDVEQDVNINNGDVVNGGNGLFKEIEAEVDKFDGKTIKVRIWYPAVGNGNYYFDFTYTFPAKIMGPQAAWDWGVAKTIYKAVAPLTPKSVSAVQVLKGTDLTLAFDDITVTPGDVEPGVSIATPTYTFQISKNVADFTNPAAIIEKATTSTTIKSGDFVVPADYFAIGNTYYFRVKASNDYGEASPPWSPVFAITPTAAVPQTFTLTLESLAPGKPGINFFSMPFTAPWCVFDATSGALISFTNYLGQTTNEVVRAYDLVKAINTAAGANVCSTFGKWDKSGQEDVGILIIGNSPESTQIEPGQTEKVTKRLRNLALEQGMGYQVYIVGTAKVELVVKNVYTE